MSEKVLIRHNEYILYRQLWQSHWSQPEAEQSVKNSRWSRCWHTQSQEGDWFTCAEKDQRKRRRRTQRGLQMAGFLDNFRWPECECIDWGERRNAVASIVSGVLVSGSRERKRVAEWLTETEKKSVTAELFMWGQVFSCYSRTNNNIVFVSSSTSHVYVILRNF